MNKYQKADFPFDSHTPHQRRQRLHTSATPSVCAAQGALNAEAPSLYALERKSGKVWIRYGLCGKRTLLERVRNSLTPLEQWRIVYVPSMQSHLHDYQKTA